MPIGGYKNFGACVSAQQRKGKSKESAQKICGHIEAQTKKSISDRARKAKHKK